MGLAVTVDDWFVTDSGTLEVVRVDPATGDETESYDCVDSDLDGLLRINPATGDREIFSEQVGDPFQTPVDLPSSLVDTPTGIEVDPDCNLVMTDTASQTVIRSMPAFVSASRTALSLVG